MPNSRRFHFFVGFFLPLTLLVTGGAYLLGATQLEAELAAIESRETLAVGRGAGAIAAAIDGISRDLRYLARNNEVERTINAATVRNVDELAAEFANFSRAKQIYDQLRWIDEFGMERVRVDLVGGDPLRLMGDKLQNKGKRYYFTDTFKLNLGEIFISPLDLNVENNTIEIPHKPMIRVATPVGDIQGIKRGIVIVNYLGSDLLRAFAEASSEIADHAMLLNNDGYWLKSPAPEDEWGFMFKRPELSLARRSPEAWAKISAADSGQVLLADALWTWQSVFPMMIGAKSSSGSVDPQGRSSGEISSRQYVWKSVARLPIAKVEDLERSIWTRMGLSWLLVMGLLTYASARLSRAWHAQELSEAKALSANAALESELDRTKNLNLKLQETKHQLLQAEKLASIGQLAAGVAHEINNPIGFVNSNLGSLAGYVQELLGIIKALEASQADGVSSGDARGVLQKKHDLAELDFLRDDIVALINESRAGLDRVKKIVADLKDFARSGAAEQKDADLNAGLESTLNVVWNEIKYKAEVVRDYGNLPLVRCDPGKINQVFMNLLVNAAHAIEQRGTITVQSRHEGDWVTVTISDTGCGIAPENLQRIFDPFFTTKPVGKGTGLGLSLAWGIIQEHHGRLEVESTPGEGTTFRVKLPVRFPCDADTPQPNVVAGSESPQLE